MHPDRTPVHVVGIKSAARLIPSLICQASEGEATKGAHRTRMFVRDEFGA
jgi:hypothetical protein